MEHARADIIPTRERADVLRKARRTVNSQDHTKLEIIVGDNFRSDGTHDIVPSIVDPRGRYVNSCRPLDMSHHWEFVLSHATYGWVTIIGDDDSLLLRVLQVVAQMAGASPRCLSAHFQHRLARDTDQACLRGERRGKGVRGASPGPVGRLRRLAACAFECLTDGSTIGVQSRA